MQSAEYGLLYVQLALGVIALLGGAAHVGASWQQIRQMRKEHLAMRKSLRRAFRRIRALEGRDS